MQFLTVIQYFHVFVSCRVWVKTWKKISFNSKQIVKHENTKLRPKIACKHPEGLFNWQPGLSQKNWNRWQANLSSLKGTPTTEIWLLGKKCTKFATVFHIKNGLFTLQKRAIRLLIILHFLNHTNHGINSHGMLIKNV
jgi:hypothetical protein